MSVTYKNPWFRPGRAEYGPAFYESSGHVTEYKGYEIHHRLPVVWDVVRNEICCTQRAGLSGAKAWVDSQQ